ncbi:hypothetical protein Tco_0705037 [Tanacetum coccineum]|uniref:Uncharacterized protein n=1 Tax=Tanacetum coccineum TaxID=301880 RepID=A0ABQ4Y4T3_9ASTR
MENMASEAHHNKQCFLKGLRSKDPLPRWRHGHGRKEACLIGWEERSQLHSHVPIVVNGVPKQKELKWNGAMRHGATCSHSTLTGMLESANKAHNDRWRYISIKQRDGDLWKDFMERLQWLEVLRRRRSSEMNGTSGKHRKKAGSVRKRINSDYTDDSNHGKEWPSQRLPKKHLSESGNVFSLWGDEDGTERPNDHRKNMGRCAFCA